MKIKSVILCCLLSAAVSASAGDYTGHLTADQLKRVTINPIPLEYKFQNEKLPRREAADPVCEWFNGKYYLFASRSSGYWTSDDMANWTYIPAPSIKNINHYAPTVMVSGDALYFTSSGTNEVYRTRRPESGEWERVTDKFPFQETDPCLWQDDDGRVYFYWGCAPDKPIYGVEVDPSHDFAPIGEPVALITHDISRHGWEVNGHDNDRNVNGFNEGATINKINGKYYLQYACPGTQYHVYGDAVYVSDSPLGPFECQTDNPFSFKPGGFLYGAGHGHTFNDRYGNLWHVSTMCVSVRHGFERRLGFFPAYVDKDGTLNTHTVMTDYPYLMPDGKRDFSRDDLSLGWSLLSHGKAASASSTLRGAKAEEATVGLENPWKIKNCFEPSNAVNEQVGNWWAAASGRSGEWLCIDLGRQMDVNAIHVNFPDHGLVKRADESFIYRYKLEGSNDGRTWTMLDDRSRNQTEHPHALKAFADPVKIRYVRLTNCEDMPEGAHFAVSGLRVFGRADGRAPERVSNVKATRGDDRRRINLEWQPVDGATGYIVRWGISPDRLTNAGMVYGDSRFEGGFYHTVADYYFTVDAFNESGITRGRKVVAAK